MIRTETRRRRRPDESGFTTAELLANAALGVIALVAIWAALGGLGGTVVDFVQQQLTGN
jgi:uncharacterized protein HemX